MPTCKIVVNGRTYEVERGLTVEQLLEQFELSNQLLAVECNREIVDRENYSITHLTEGDHVEIVRFVGGG